jgi:5-oxoprolinase (ATP-hydrolysing)
MIQNFTLTMREAASKWRFAIDRGGTFTDIVALDPDGNFHTLKLLSSSPVYRDASIEGMRRVLGLRSDKLLPHDQIAEIRIGTTVATNTLLERKGGRVALLITKGFSDLLEIGYQDRPEIFKLCIKKPSPLYSAVLEVDERIDCAGGIIKRLNVNDLSRHVEELRKTAVDTVAVVLMHSWKNPVHELLCEKILKESGFSSIILSHRAVNLIKLAIIAYRQKCSALGPGGRCTSSCQGGGRSRHQRCHRLRHGRHVNRCVEV